MSDSSSGIIYVSMRIRKARWDKLIKIANSQGMEGYKLLDKIVRDFIQKCDEERAAQIAAETEC